MTGAALILTLSVAVGSALAYFTAYVTASGSGTVSLGVPDTDLQEEVVDQAKWVTIKNIGSYDCYVRVRAFSGAETSLKYEDQKDGTQSGGTWSMGEDGYWYYNAILPAGETTGTLKIGITLPEAADSANVIVVQECTPVLYQEDGTPYADWSYGISAGSAGAEEGN